MNNPVLIAGAGPTGLVLALWLTRSGVKVRIVDAAAGPGTTSRALVVHARTLELYRELGIEKSVIDGGVKFTGANLWVRGSRRTRVPVGDIGQGLSAYPFVLVYPQDAHEHLLVAELEKAGVRVERDVTLTGFTDDGDHVTATLQRKDGAVEVTTARYLAGCDGAHSRVRETLGTGFPGGTYPALYFVADVEAEGGVMNGEFNVALDSSDFLAIFPMKGEGRARFVGQLRTGKDPRSLRWEDVSPRILQELAIDVKKVHWFSSYRVHHRVSSHFRRGRAFLLGDAAHIHSPVGGQGMNTGIGDAVNLAWKLADVIQGRAPESILDSYEPERIAFARKLVRTTDGAFRFASASGALAAFVRTKLVSRLLPLALSIPGVKRFLYRTVSQTGITYRDCAFNEGSCGGLRGGDRLPWVEALDNFAPLDGRTWQIHVYGAAGAAELREIVPAVKEFPFTEAAGKAGLTRDALYLVRPDGYLAFVGRTIPAVRDYVARRGLHLGR